MEDSEYADNTIMVTHSETPDLDDLEQRVRLFLRWEAKVLLDSLTPTEPDTAHDRTFIFPSEKVSPVSSEDTTGSQASTPQVSESQTRWRPRTTKWRQFLQSVQSAILNLVARIENSTRSTDSVPNIINGRQNMTNGANNSSVVPSSKNTTTHWRRREQDGSSARLKHRTQEAELSDDSQGSKDGAACNPTSGSNGKPARKLSVYIPKVMVSSGNDGDSVLTPQSTRRLEGLAESVRDEFVAMRDVYLGGSCIVRTSWREERVIPILERSNLTYYVPAMNDYSRMFSAPPYTPANGAKFTFDGVNNTSHHRKQFTGSSRHSSNMSRPVSLRTEDSVLSPADINNSRLRLEETRDGEFSYEGRGAHKHERSPTLEGDQPEKKPKYSREGSLKSGEEEEVEIRRKGSEGPYPLHGGGDNRLSASDFYRIPENASPAPFRGMYDDRQIWGSRVLFFGVTRDTRCLAPMVLAAHCIGLRSKAVVLCVQLLDNPEGLSERAVKDYNRGRLYLIDLAKRENIPVFDNLEDATQCVIQKLRNKDY